MKPDMLKLLESTLKSAGVSITEPRRVVFELLEGKEPQSMADLLRRAGGRINRATLYRTIELFEQIGVAKRIHVGWKYKLELAEAFTHHHHHLSCTQCGRIIGISEAAAEELIGALAAAHNFEPTAHQLEIQGLCASCKRQPRPSSRPAAPAQN